jgi:alcohol dehydrogenase
MIQKEYFGKGSIKKLKRILKENKSKKVFLVTGKKSFETSGAKEKIETLLKNNSYLRFNEFSPNPSLRDINRGYLKFKNYKSDLIIGVGGGSTIDVAKKIGLLFFNEAKKKIPMVAIPTTSGTGSEATYFIVYYKNNKKQSDGKPNLTLPDYSICDPHLIENLPPKICAETGMDSLTQAVESYWSVYSNSESKKYSKKAIKIILKNIEAAVNGDRKAKSRMLKASNLSGKAINISKTTACHSIGYPITSNFKIPHGQAVGITLPEIILYNAHPDNLNCTDPRGKIFVKKTINKLNKILGTKNPIKSKYKIQSLMKKIGLKTKLSELGIKRRDIAILIKEGFTPERMLNNPVKIESKDLKKILNKIY